MNNDNLPSCQTPSALPSPQDQVLQSGDAPVETESFDPKMDFACRADPEHLEVFSLSHLRSNFPDVKDRVNAAWYTLCTLIVEHVPDDDHRHIGLVLVEDMVALSGVEISEASRKYAEKYHRIPRP